MIVKTFAKLNLFLRVLRRRPDGYHDIETVFHGIDLFDDLEVARAADGKITVETSVEGFVDALLPEPSDNLVTVAAQELAHRRAINEGAAIRLRKRIPIGAGLGGGSANAAGALIALNEMWDMGLDEEALIDVATEIGSDVPYCLVGGTARATSRGELVTKLPVATGLHFVLGVSSEVLSTRAVYDAWDDVGTTTDFDAQSIADALAAGDADRVGAALHNDLETAAFSLRPELADAKVVMSSKGALGSAMSGSGPTIFGIARDRAHATSLASSVEDAFDRVMVVGSHAVGVELLA